MKLIRLEGVSSKAEFENTFNEDIILPEKAKIGLLNMAYTPRLNASVDETNDTFQFMTVKDTEANINAGRKHEVKLDHGTYFPEDFMKMLTRKINGGLVFTLDNTNISEVGFMWRPHINFNDRLVFGFNRSGGSKPRLDDKEFGGMTYTFATNLLEQTVQPASAFGGSCLSYNNLIRGCGLYRCQLVKIADTLGNNTNNFCIGFVDKVDVTIDPVFNPTNMVFGLRTRYTGDGAGVHTYNYQFLINGVDTTLDDTIQVVDNNVIVFSLNGGIISAIVYTNNSTGATNGTTIGQYTYPYVDKLHPIVSASSDGFRLSTFAWNRDPYFIRTHTGMTDQIETIIRDNYISFEEDELAGEDLGTPPTPHKARSASFVTIFFSDLPKTGQTMGFSDEILQKNVISGEFIADSSLFLSISVPSIIVEIPSIKFESFDGSPGMKKRRNMISVVPTSIKDNRHIYYQTDNPVMISIDNKNELTLRNISVRLTDLDNEVILIRDGTDVSISIVIGD